MPKLHKPLASRLVLLIVSMAMVVVTLAGCSSGKYPQCPWGGCHFCFPNKVPPSPNDCQQPFVNVPCSGFTPTCWAYWPEECGNCPPGANPGCMPPNAQFEALPSVTAPMPQTRFAPESISPSELPPSASLELLPTPPSPNAIPPEDSNLPPNA
jgi:hypothetical protein